MKTAEAYREEPLIALLGPINVLSSRARVVIGTATRRGFITLDEVLRMIPKGVKKSNGNLEEKTLMVLNILSALKIAVISDETPKGGIKFVPRKETPRDDTAQSGETDSSVNTLESGENGERGSSKEDLDAVQSIINQTELYEPSWADRHDLLYLYLGEIGKFSLLSRSQEVEMMKRIEAGDRAAWEEFVHANLRLVVWVVRRYARIIENLTVLDLIQEGTLGLFQAIKKFDYRQGYKFSTYAIWWIRQAAHRAIDNQEHTIRIPVHLSELIRKFRKAEREHTKSVGIEPAFNEVAQALCLTREETIRLEEALRLQKIVSLDDPETSIDEDGETPLWARIVDTVSLTPEEILVEKSSHRTIQGALHVLNEREREVLAMRIGDNGDKTFTLEEIGRRFGFSRERARQIAATALRKVLDVLDSKPLAPKSGKIDIFQPISNCSASENDIVSKHAKVCGEGKDSDKVLDVVSKTYGVSIDDMIGPSRKTIYTWPRHIAMYLLNIDFSLSFPTIGKIFNRDHTSVLHACERIKAIVMQNKEVSHAVAAIRANYLWR